MWVKVEVSCLIVVQVCEIVGNKIEEVGMVMMMPRWYVSNSVLKSMIFEYGVVEVNDCEMRMVLILVDPQLYMGGRCLGRIGGFVEVMEVF